MRNIKWFGVIAIVLITTMVLAGCARSEGSGSKNSLKMEQELSALFDDLSSFHQSSLEKFNEIIKDIPPQSFANVLKNLSAEAQAYALTLTPNELITSSTNFFSASPGGDFSYELNSEGNGIIITRYTGRNPFLVFPAEIEGYPVVQIGKGSGSGNYIAPYYESQSRDRSFIVSVVIPEGIKTIAQSAFYGQRKLINISFPASLTEIGSSSFSNCSFETVDLSKTNLVEISQAAFQLNRNLRTVNLPETVTIIQRVAFENCRSLTDINIPLNIKTIEPHVFRDCGELFNLHIPDNINSINFIMSTTINPPTNNAFSGCGKLPIATRQRLQALGYTGNF
ncbi:MAG: leucine-rich repeat domain-containing protein [Treponema sp.]|nr:leucine-rich repeat domain-containing protein [Treponema sp.]